MLSSTIKQILKNKVTTTNYPTKNIFTFFTNDINLIIETLNKHIKINSTIRAAILKALEIKMNNNILIIVNKKWINIQLKTTEGKMNSINNKVDRMFSIAKIKNKDYNASIILFGQYRNNT